MTITESTLQECYFDATKNNGLIDLTKNLSNPEFELKIHDIKIIFKNSPLWIRSKQNTGHCKFTHEITKIVIEFQGHSSKKDRTVKPYILTQILENVRKHLNILSNEIFIYITHNWKTEPDYQSVLKRVNKNESGNTKTLRIITQRHLVW